MKVRNEKEHCEIDTNDTNNSNANAAPSTRESLILDFFLIMDIQHLIESLLL
jgi:hypothetical protein